MKLLLMATMSTTAAESGRGQSEGFLGGFTSFPNEIYGDSALSVTDRAVYIAFRSFAYGRRDDIKSRLSCYPSVERVARRAGVDPKTVSNSLPVLINRGFLYRRYESNRRSKVTYFVTNRVAFLRDRTERNHRYAMEQEDRRRRSLIKYNIQVLKGVLDASQANARLLEAGIECPLYHITNKEE